MAKCCRSFFYQKIKKVENIEASRHWNFRENYVAPIFILIRICDLRSGTRVYFPVSFVMTDNVTTHHVLTLHCRKMV